MANFTTFRLAEPTYCSPPIFFDLSGMVELTIQNTSQNIGRNYDQHTLGLLSAGHLIFNQCFGNLAFAQSLPAEILFTTKRLNVRSDVSESRLGSLIRGQQFQLQSTK